MEIKTNSEIQTEEAGRALAKRLKPGDIVALYGGLGAGKTAFVRGIAAGIGSTARVSSPTFNIVNEYPGPVTIFHFDMYRLSSADELYDIGWEDYLLRHGICIIEWTENITEALCGSEISVRISAPDDCTRIITVEGDSLLHE